MPKPNNSSNVYPAVYNVRYCGLWLSTNNNNIGYSHIIILLYNQLFTRSSHTHWPLAESKTPVEPTYSDDTRCGNNNYHGRTVKISLETFGNTFNIMFWEHSIRGHLNVGMDYPFIENARESKFENITNVLLSKSKSRQYYYNCN